MSSPKENSKLRRHSSLLIHDEYYNENYFINSDRSQERTCTANFNRANRSDTSNEDLQERGIFTYVYSIPTVFRYDQATLEEKTCASMDDIPEIKENECVWIDIVGVSKSIDLIMKNP